MSDGISAMFDRMHAESKENKVDAKVLLKLCEHHENMVKVHLTCLHENLEKLKETLV